MLRRTYHELMQDLQTRRLVATAFARLVEGLALADLSRQRRLAGVAGVARLRGASRGPARVAQARQRAMYLAHVAGGFSLSAVGLAFGRDRTTVRHACALWEDARDDRAVDAALGLQEIALGAMAAHLRLVGAEAHTSCGSL